MIVESSIKVVTGRKRQFVDVIRWDDIGQFTTVLHCEGIRDHHLLPNFGIITPMMKNSFPSPLPTNPQVWSLFRITFHINV